MVRFDKEKKAEIVSWHANAYYWCNIDSEKKNDIHEIISIAENFDLEVIEGEEMIDEAEDTITILSKYVNSLELENKKELDSLMKSLYTESLTMETL